MSYRETKLNVKQFFCALKVIFKAILHKAITEVVQKELFVKLWVTTEKIKE